MKKQAKQARAIKAVLYARISVDRDTESSIANQLREMRQLCQLNGWEIVGEYSDRGRSAFKVEVEREGFEEAMTMIESGQANHLVVWKLDRMTRNARGWVKINERLETADATFASQSEPWFDTSSPIGYALVGLMVALAEMEAEGIQGRILMWHRGRIESLMPPVGPRPYGYDREKANQLTINESEATVIREMVSRVLKGDSLTTIARNLTALGIPTATGGTNWAVATIRGIVTNPTIAALVDCDGSYVGSDKWDAIIEPATWELVANVLPSDGPTRIYERQLLSQLIHCAKCGEHMSAIYQTKGRRYKCVGCTNSIRQDLTDDVVSEWILDNVSDSEWQSLRTQGRGTDPRVVDELQGRIHELWIERATNPNRIHKDVYESTMAQLESQLSAAMDEPAVKLPDVDSLHDGWATMSNDDQRLVIKALALNVKVHPYAKGCTLAKRIKVDAA